MLKFMKSFVQSPTTTGAVLPSSKKLAELITQEANLENATSIVEFGTGTGVFTKKIMQKKSKDAVFIAIELNPELAQITKKQCPGAVVYNDSAENTRKYLDIHGIQHCDCIISGLPWAIFNEELQEKLLEAVIDALKPGGDFLTFAYLNGVITPAGKRFKRKLQSLFSSTQKTPTVWANVPPAFVYHCKK